jgi:hypothetical protein
MDDRVYMDVKVGQEGPLSFFKMIVVFKKGVSYATV